MASDPERAVSRLGACASERLGNDFERIRVIVHGEHPDAA
jgi:hypothetical protein